MHVCQCTWATEPHPNWGACIRAKNIGVGDLQGRNVNKQWDSDRSAYDAARRTGVRPKTTARADVNAAVRASDNAGVAWRADQR